jgi:hypothetical protein
LNGSTLHLNYSHIISGAYDFFIQAWLSDQVAQIDQLMGVKFTSNWEYNQDERSIHVTVLEVRD